MLLAVRSPPTSIGGRAAPPDPSLAAPDDGPTTGLRQTKPSDAARPFGPLPSVAHRRAPLRDRRETTPPAGPGCTPGPARCGGASTARTCIRLHTHDGGRP